MKVFIFVFGALIFANLPAFAQCANPNGIRGELLFNDADDVFQVCTARGWMALHARAPDPCAGTPSPGDICHDGSVYAGLSPDGNVPMYTTPADAGQFSWNDGTTNWLDIPALTNCSNLEAACNTGEANTALLASIGTGPSPAPYEAARHCYNLTAHGHSDWYLPARHELNVLDTNRMAIGGFDISGANPSGVYWSSSEYDNDSTWGRYFNGTGQNARFKRINHSVRCVRK